MSIVSITKEEQFESAIAQGVVLVDFWAPWCGPCKMIAPVLEELGGKLGDTLSIVKVNVDDNPDTAGKYGIMSIPTLKLFKDGREVGTQVGFVPLAQLEAWVREQL
ncbi:thioredoxin [Paenibacillus mucilaginosus]|uniref:Thioredoxin n=3 Tax=Paenibacillus mucilaginosus TaxID=61624 RepID=H6NQJ9_9BACL|nr:thioredoxin [Paenibacillus mucilaginosus]AEI45817.1 TrxA2 [Paenibacillus mucilaginosus KNP414]AFC33467.1 TrxA2 [Paenibacillus mucilaginosus 3016]AFH65787.1 thioredoxin [Paenibacillus mucilaginosus K02]MCG7215003.1 thioredoxin [Paenibacillus mucilaginosus]WDM27187.1 thioredoxin [Paenibacillus mucilaginosus]